MKPIFLLLTILIIFSVSSFSQSPNSSKTFYSTNSEKYITEESSKGWVYFKSSSKVNTEDFFTIFHSYLGITKDDTFAFVKESSYIGLHHEWYQQYHKGVKVVGGEYVLHSRNGDVVTANGNAISNITVNTIPTFSAKSAISALQKNITLPLGKDDSAFINRWIKDLGKTEEDLLLHPELVLIYDNYLKQPQASDYRLCYKFSVIYIEMVLSEYVYIDANTGEVFKREPMAVNCTLGNGQTTWYGAKNINTTFSGAAYILDEQCLNSHGNVHTKQYSSWGTGTEYTDIDNNWNNLTAVTAHWNGRQSLDYFYNTFNRNSYDNLGSGFVILNEAFGSPTGTPLDNNSYFDASNKIMYLGRGGNQQSALDDLNTLDIVGHELTHGVTASSCALAYQNESGALDESFSDIFGVAIERYVKGTNNFNWLIGDELSTGAIRNLSDPTHYGKHLTSNTCTACGGGCASSIGLPNTYYGTNWYTGLCDHGGVHTNSAVQSYWFYLLVNGGSGTNDNGFQYNVTGIGFTDAINMVYTELTAGYLSSTSDYNSAFTASKLIAATNWGYSSNQFNSVINAWCAVGIGYNCVTATQTTPPNDNCDQATWLQSNTSCSWLTNQTVEGATADGFPQRPSCDLFSGTPSMCGVFYKFNAQATTETITVDPTGNSTLDAIVVLYSGTTCTALTEVGCIDQPGGAGVTTTLTANNLTIGNTYWIRVYDYGNTAPTDGHFQICISHQGQSTTCGSPTNLSQSGITQTSANLSWSSISGSSFYQVVYKNLSTQNTYTQNSSINSITLSNLSCGSNYEWSIVAYCNGTPSAASSTSSFQTSSCPAGCNQLTLSAYGNTYTSPATIGDFNVFSNTNCSWTASSNQSFVSITIGSTGMGNGTVGFSIQNNSTGASRTCAITVTANGLTAAYVITQQAATVSYADLIITNYSLNPNILAQNDYLLIPYTLSNIGTTSASPSRVGIYLSTDCTLSGDDQLLVSGYDLFGTLAAGASQPMTGGATINPTSPGNYYILIVADQNNSVFEGTIGEANNVVCLPITVTSCGSQSAPPNPILSGSGHICGNGSTDIVINNYDHSLKYSWLGGVIGNFDTINGKFTATSAGLISCQARNQCGAYSYGNYITVVQDSLPIINAGHDTTIYKWQSVQLNATSSTTVSYTWTPITYLTNATINNPVTAPLTSTSYNVNGATQYGCMGSDNIIVYVIDTTCFNIVAPNITGDTTVCDNQTTQLNAGSGYSGYAWSNNATQQTTNVAAGNYTVTVTTSTGCTASAQIIIMSNNSPVDTSLQVNNGCDLAAATISGANYQWYRNGNAIPNATSQYYTANQNGYYHVSIAVGNCFYQSSDHYLVCLTGIEEATITNLKVYPNPTDGTFIISGLVKNATQLYVNLYNTLGQVVYAKNISLNSPIINAEVTVQNLSTGIYHLQLLIDQQPYNYKLLFK